MNRPPALSTLAPMPRLSVLTLLLCGCLATAALAVGQGLSRPSTRASAEVSTPPRRPPVVMIVLDEFPVDHLLRPDGRIDEGRYPGFAALAETATWFPNAHTVYDSTTKAVPAILDARWPRPGTSPTYLDHPRTVYDLFARHGYRIVRSEEASSLCPPRHCRGARAGSPGVLGLLHSGRPARLHRFVKSIRPGPPTFYMKHLLLPHGPHLYLPSGHRARRAAGEQLPGIETVPGFANRSATDYNQQRLLLQIGYVDRELRRLVRRMKRLRMFDRALVVVTADHGISSEVGVGSRRRTTRANIDELAPVPLFVKAPRQRRGRVAPALARTIDVVPTMADVLGFRMPYRADGRSAFSRAVRRRRSVRVVARDFSGTISAGAREMERRRRVLLRTRVRRFGWGDWASLYTGIGPHRELLGRSLDELRGARAGRSSSRGRLIAARELLRVRPGSNVVPTQVNGRGGGRDSAGA